LPQVERFQETGPKEEGIGVLPFLGNGLVGQAQRLDAVASARRLCRLFKQIATLSPFFLGRSNRAAW